MSSNSVTSSNPAVATVDKASMKVLGQAKGTATISVVVNTADGLKTIQKTVTVSDDARVAQSIKSNATEGVFTYSLASLPSGDDLAVDDAGTDLFFTVTDQYGGTALTPVDYIISDEVDADDSMTVSITSGALTITGADASDSVKVTAVDASGHTSTVTIKFTN
ncbi:Ig-like domain-containing protein [Xylanivirga thermophila]|uniref:Ig-like domain-containing protein n=1 Tax=Xylanivirga thermophila TaxID=2496273 RepID=UPI00312046FC